MKKKAFPVLIVVAIIILIIAGIVIGAVVKKYTPTKETADLYEHYGISDESTVAIILNDTDSAVTASLIDGQIYLDLDFVQDSINSRFYWDSNENILLYTTATDIVMADVDTTEYSVSKNTEDFGSVIVKSASGSPLINIDFVKQYSDLSYSYFEEPSRLVITTGEYEVTTALVKKATQLRELGGIKSPIMKELEKKEHVTVLSEDETWTCIMTDDGLIGYMKSDHLSDQTTETVSTGYVEETFNHVKYSGQICLGWNYIGSSSANSKIASTIKSSKGINVIAPTWFYLDDEEGNICDLGSSDYVDYCHEHDIEVWAMIDNLTNTEVSSTTVLTHTSSRQNLVNQIISLALQYDLDGVNVDFEALDSAVGDSYIQFIRELAIKCHNNGLVLSVDNYVPTDYTSFYNRAEQAVFADYIVIMGYDEHTAGSEEAGSVADLAWVTQGVTDTLASVPADQIILGMPLYTRLWCETPQADNSDEDGDSNVLYTLSSQALSMNEQNNLIESKDLEKNWDSNLGQFYVTYEEKGNTYEMWLEDSDSIDARLNLMVNNGLAGCALWRLGYETSDIWDTIAKYY